MRWRPCLVASKLSARAALRPGDMLMPDHEGWPSLDLAEWEPTYRTLHRYTQIVGKVQLSLAHFMNHWWHVPLHVTASGLATAAMPVDHRSLNLTLDFCTHRLVAATSDHREAAIPLESIPVAEFYARVVELLRGLDVPLTPSPVAVEMVDRTPLDRDRANRTYDPAAVQRLHQILVSTASVFEEHRGRFLGKVSPVHFFWGAFDLAVTRFSGRRNPSPPADPMNREAYSHEVISHGFWPGGDWPVGGRVAEPVFYAYAVPEPPGFRDVDVTPARYAAAFGEFVLPYEAVRRSPDPAKALLTFLESTYEAAATRAGWPVQDLTHASP